MISLLSRPAPLLSIILTLPLFYVAGSPPQPTRVQDVKSKIEELEKALADLRALAPRSDTDLHLEQSVKPGINESWKSDEIGPLVRRLEGESREIFIERARIASVVGPLKGMRVADIGAGSGFMTHIFAHQVGAEGRVYAVDINAKLIEHITSGAAHKKLANVEAVVCSEKSVELPENSVDLVFICDTYHHFEYPKNTMTSIHRALKPNGQLVIVDFHRIPGVSREWVLDHVRAGEEVVTKEIEEAGFELTNTHALPDLQENYILRFRRVEIPY